MFGQVHNHFVQMDQWGQQFSVSFIKQRMEFRESLSGLVIDEQGGIPSLISIIWGKVVVKLFSGTQRRWDVFNHLCFSGSYLVRMQPNVRTSSFSIFGRQIMRDSLQFCESCLYQNLPHFRGKTNTQYPRLQPCFQSQIINSSINKYWWPPAASERKELSHSLNYSRL